MKLEDCVAGIRANRWQPIELETLIFEWVDEFDASEIQMVLAELEKSDQKYDVPLEVYSELYAVIADYKKGQDPLSFRYHAVRTATTPEELKDRIRQYGCVDKAEEYRLRAAMSLEKTKRFREAIHKYQEARYLPGVVWTYQRIEHLYQNAQTLDELKTAVEYALSEGKLTEVVGHCIRIIQHHIESGKYIDAGRYLDILTKYAPEHSETVEAANRYFTLPALASIQDCIDKSEYIRAHRLLVHLEKDLQTEDTSKLRKELHKRGAVFAIDFFDRLLELPNYRRRLQQVDMANQVESAVMSGEPVMIEAEVGIGKSYGYLAPLMLWKSRKMPDLGCIVVSTSNIPLQTQLVDKDIPAMNELLYKFFKIRETDVIIGKGRGHFACSKRIKALMEPSIGADNRTLSKRERVELKSFLETSPFLDKDDCPNSIRKFWDRISAEGCKCKTGCKYVNYREKLSSFNGIIVCNHQQLIAHLNNDIFAPDIFPQNIDAIVIDEAHKLEDAAKSIFTDQRSIEDILSMLNHLDGAFMNRKLDKEGDTFLNYRNTISQLTEVFKKLETHLQKWLIVPSFNARERLVEQGGDVEDTTQFKVDMDQATRTFQGIIQLFQEVQDGIKTAQVLGYEDLFQKSIERDLKRVREILESFLDPQSYITWVDTDAAQSQLSFASMKKKYSQFLSKTLLQSGMPVVLVSGTLAIGGSFEYFTEKFGYTQEYPEPSILQSDFNYTESRIAYIGCNLPTPRLRDEDYYDELSREIEKLIGISKGRSLVLFTNYDDLMEVSVRIRSTEFHIFTQDKQANRRTLLRGFREDVNSCLLATGSFFEGIDIPGESLEQVIITKLPYPILDPVLEQEIQIAGNKRMEKVLLPRMIIQLRQAIGRLIRNERDHGIISILDSRVCDEGTLAKTLVFDALSPSKIVTDIAELQQTSEANNM